MPGLPEIPASDNIDIDADGNIVGLAKGSASSSDSAVSAES